MIPEQNLHDGFVDGVLVEKGSAKIFVRTVGREKFTILLSGVETLILNDFRQGNIILSLDWLDATKISDESICDYHHSKPGDADPDALRSKFVHSIEGQQLRALEISPSYGADLVAIFKESEIRSGYL
jgi:hypothetical protein